ncbi:unnamed protein product, partial [marine sediment metagenome]
LILYSISIAKFFPAYYSGYQKITKSIALQQLENPLFNNPVDAAIMLPGNVRVTFIVDEGWHRVVYTKENQDYLSQLPRHRNIFHYYPLSNSDHTCHD